MGIKKVRKSCGRLMEKKKIFFSDHGRIPQDMFVGLEFDEIFMAPLRDLTGSVERTEARKNATHLIVHYTYDDKEKSELTSYIEKWKTSSEYGDQIALLVSAGGQEDLRRQSHQVVTPEKNGRQVTLFVLNAHNQEALKKKEVAIAFYTMSCADAEAVFKGNLTGVSSSHLKELFAIPQYAALQQAFTVLCQGYLAVHAEYKKQDKDWKDQDIAPALEQMGWDSVDKSLIPRRLGKKEKIEKVRNPGWWWIVFESYIEDRKSLLAAVKKEWDESGDKEISKELEDLIRLIVEKNEVKPPKIVAKAYLALVEKLGV